MKRITVPELKYVVDELKSIRGRKIENIYQNDDEMRFVIGNKELLLTEFSIHLAKPSKKRNITSFALILRKYLRNKVVNGISSKYLSVELLINSNKLILEIFPRFNCILCNTSNEIIMPMKFYTGVRPGETYVEEGLDYRSKERFRKFLSKKLPAAVIVRDYFGKYVKIPKYMGEKTGRELKEAGRTVLLKEIRILMKKEKHPQVIYKGRKLIDAVPFDLDIYKRYKKKYFDTFNEALAFFFSRVKSK
jgi:predicted ribosome quality control (RQC) complex YloA/Tae2 family protein